MAKDPASSGTGKGTRGTGKPTSAPTGPLILLDGMSLAFRAYFALPADLVTTTGVVTNAVHGFASMVVNLIRDHRPAGLAVAFDMPGGTFRDDLVADYKAGRAETPDDLLPQFDMIRALLASVAIPVVESAGYEADDVLATLATEARDRAEPVIIVTGDRDAYQLVEDPYVRVLYNRRGVSDYALYDEAGIEQRTGVRPSSYAVLAALRGDPSDNLPGVPGVGEKTAAKLVNEYGGLDTLYANLDALSPKLRQNLADHEDQVRSNLCVIPLIRDVPMDVHVDQLTLGGWDREEAHQGFAELELRTLWPRLETLMDEGALGRPAKGGDPTRAGSATASGGSRPAPPEPEWLAHPKATVPGDAASAVSALDELFSSARSGTGIVAVHAGWVGGAGRSPLASLTLACEPGDNRVEDGSSPTPIVHLRGPVGPVAGDVSQGDEPIAEGPGSDWPVDGGDAAGSAPDGVLTDPAVLGSLAAALGPEGCGVVAHDAKEVMRSLLVLGVDMVRLELDTAVAAYLLDPSIDRYWLADLARTHIGVEIDDGAGGKGQGTLDLDADARATGAQTTGPRPSGTGTTPVELTEGPERAALQIVSVLARLRTPVTEALTAVDERTLYSEVDQPLVRVLARMEVTGVPVDREVLRSIAADLAGQCRDLETAIHDLAGGPFRINSVPQLREVLYERLALTPLRKTKTGFSTDARTLEQFRDQHPIVEALLRYREVEKLRSTYGESLAAEVAPDGRIHATFHQTVARTGRLSSDRPNLHNIPVRTDLGRRFREAFVPSAGRRLLVADYDQVELRAIAHLSGDPGLTAAFAAGEDIHRTVAARVFGVAGADVSPAQRSTAKMVSYGLAYGMESYGLSQRLAVPVEVAQEILDNFFTAFPSVRDYMEGAVAEARQLGYTVTAFGRRRPLPDLAATNYQIRQAAERQAMNAGIQGLAADLFKIALARLDRGLEEGGFASDLLLQVHDEVLVDVVDEESEDVARLTEASLIGAADLSVPLEVDMAWGSSWAEAKGS